MVFPRQFAIGLFDLVGGCVFCDPENFVVVLVFHRAACLAAKMIKGAAIIPQYFEKASRTTALTMAKLNLYFQ
jgi:hypothetical protein